MHDIQEKKKLTAFIKKRSEWFSWYESRDEEPNAIERQIHLMLLSEMSYRVLLEERKYQQNAYPATLPVLNYLLESGYFSSQILAIRRLFDKDSRVLSLRRVLNELKSHRNLLTREVFVCFDGTPYNPDPAQITKPGLQQSDSPFSQYARSDQRQRRFDSLTKKSSDNRSRSDLVHPDIFDRLEDWFMSSEAQKLIFLSHKFVAHAADEQSRGRIEAGILFLHIESVQRAVVRVSRAIFDIILNSGVYSEVVPGVPLGFLGKVWDGDQMVETTSRMQTHWDEMTKVRNDWAHGIDKELFV